MNVLKLPAADIEAEDYYLPAEKLLSGNPKQTVWVEYSDPSGKFHVGVWQSEVGKWRIAYTEEEYCELLEGTSIISDSTGKSVRVTAGDRFVVPKGYVGTWEVIETTKKNFVIYEASA